MSDYNTKPHYRWKDGHFQELEQNIDNVISLPVKGTYVAVWNALAQRWEFGLSQGDQQHIERVWHINNLPAEFRAGLLLMGVT